MKTKVSWLFLTIFFVFPIFASAQVYLPPPPPVPNMSNVIINNHIMNQLGINAVGQQMLGNELLKQMTKKGGQNKSAKNTSVQSVFSKQLAFVASGNWALAEKLTQGKQNPSPSRQQLEQLFTYLQQNYYVRSFAPENRELGMPYEDVGTTFIYYLLNSYMTTNDVNSIEVGKSLAVYKQVSAVLLNNPEFLKMTNRDKELLAEIFIVTGSLPSLILDTTRDRAKAKQTANENLERIFGQNAGKLKITENGIEF